MNTKKTIIVVLLGVAVLWIDQSLVEAKTPSGHNTKKDLVAHWNFEEAEEDNPVVDNVLRNGLNGEIYGAVRNNGTMVFDGEDDYIVIRGVRRLASLGKGSISVWFKFESVPLSSDDPDASTPSVHPIFYAGDGENSGLIIEVGHLPIRDNTKLYFTINTTGGDSFRKPVFCFDSNVDLKLGEWNHFVAVVGDDFNTGYLNGVKLSERHYNFAVGVGDRDKQEVGPTNSIFFDDVAVTECWIGKGIFLGSEEYFDGSIDEIRIYEEPLTSDQVLELYHEGD